MENETLQMLAVPPGNYQEESVEYTSNLLGVVESIEPFSLEEHQEEGYKTDFIVAPNTAVYLGDFIVGVEISYHDIPMGYMKSTKVTTINFEIYPTENKFERTTIDLQEKYPVLKESDITFVSHM